LQQETNAILIHGAKKVPRIEARYADDRAALQQAGTQVDEKTEHVVAGYQSQHNVAMGRQTQRFRSPGDAANTM